MKMNSHDPKFQHREKEVEGEVTDEENKKKSERKLIKSLKMLDEMRVLAHTHHECLGNVNEQECQESLIYTLHIDVTEHC